jgi:hypothetical protein
LDLRQSPREYIEALWRENPTEGEDPSDKGPSGPEAELADGRRSMRP